MKVKATKTMVNEINKVFQNNEKFKDYYARISTSYDFFEGEKQVITIIYPDNYYAIPKTLDNEELATIFKMSDKTYNGFFNTLLECIEI